MTEMVHEALCYIAGIFFWSTATVLAVSWLICGTLALIQKRKAQEERPLPKWIRRMS